MATQVFLIIFLNMRGDEHNRGGGLGGGLKYNLLLIFLHNIVLCKGLINLIQICIPF